MMLIKIITYVVPGTNPGTTLISRKYVCPMTFQIKSLT